MQMATRRADVFSLLLGCAHAQSWPPNWKAFAYNQFERTMTMIVIVSIDGTVVKIGKLAALVGDEVRGVADADLGPPFGPYAGSSMFYLKICARNNNIKEETIHFHYSAGEGTLLLSRHCCPPLLFKSDRSMSYILGSAIAPEILNGTIVRTLSPSPPPRLFSLSPPPLDSVRQFVHADVVEVQAHLLQPVAALACLVASAVLLFVVRRAFYQQCAHRGSDPTKNRLSGIGGFWDIEGGTPAADSSPSPDSPLRKRSNVYD